MIVVSCLVWFAWSWVFLGGVGVGAILSQVWAWGWVWLSVVVLRVFVGFGMLSDSVYFCFMCAGIIYISAGFLGTWLVWVWVRCFWLGCLCGWSVCLCSWPLFGFSGFRAFG